jgi:Ca2+-binding RTX toxin-like protein
MGTSFVVSMLTGVATLIVTTASLGTGPHEASAAEDAAVPSCRGRTATIVGTDRNDRIKGSPGPDVIVGRGGDDVIRGEQGNDVLCGGYGNDELVGLAGNDRLSGGPGEDGLFGVGGNDIEVGAEETTS